MPFSGLTHGDGEWAEEMAQKTAVLPEEEKSWPDSFSQIRDLDAGNAELKEKFPLFPGKAAAREIHVGEGAISPASCSSGEHGVAPFCSITWSSSAHVRSSSIES